MGAHFTADLSVVERFWYCILYDLGRKLYAEVQLCHLPILTLSSESQQALLLAVVGRLENGGPYWMFPATTGGLATPYQSRTMSHILHCWSPLLDTNIKPNQAGHSLYLLLRSSKDLAGHLWARYIRHELTLHRQRRASQNKQFTKRSTYTTLVNGKFPDHSSLKM